MRVLGLLSGKDAEFCAFVTTLGMQTRQHMRHCKLRVLPKYRQYEER